MTVGLTVAESYELTGLGRREANLRKQGLWEASIVTPKAKAYRIYGRNTKILVSGAVGTVVQN